MEEIGKILPSLLKPQLRSPEAPVVEMLVPFWGRVVGKALAGQCRPSAFCGGTLTLATDSAEWVAPVEQLAVEILRQVNAFLGKSVVRRITVVRARKIGRAVPAKQQASTRAGKARVESKARLHAQEAERPRTQSSRCKNRKVL